MGILFRYILWQYVKILLLCQIGLTTVYLVIDFFEKLRRFLKYDAEFIAMVTYFYFKIPEISFKLAPLAGLMATLLTIGILNKNQEITAMRSCGWSFFQITSPFLLIGVGMTVILFACAAVIIPMANDRAEFIKTVKIEGKPLPQAFTATNLWLRIRDNTILHIDEVSPNGSILQNVHVYGLNANFKLDTLIHARQAQFANGKWTLHSLTKRHITPKGTVTANLHKTFPLDLSLTPNDFEHWVSFQPDHMTLQELRKHINHLQEEGHSISSFLTDYWGRISFAFGTLILTLIGVAIGFLRLERRTTSMGKGIGQALAIGFLFWTTHSVGIALGRSGALVPLLAGWIACIMFFAVSLNLLLKVRL
jgi:lipopolysaccharide export system permease protein